MVSKYLGNYKDGGRFRAGETKRYFRSNIRGIVCRVYGAGPVFTKIHTEVYRGIQGLRKTAPSSYL